MLTFLIKFLLPFIILIFIKKFLDNKSKDRKTSKYFLYIISQVLNIVILILGAIIVISLLMYFMPNLGFKGENISYIGNFISLNIFNVLIWVITTPLLLIELIVLSLLVVKRNKTKDAQPSSRNYIVFTITFVVTMVVAILFAKILNSPDISKDDIFYSFTLLYPATFFAFVNSLLLSEIVRRLPKTDSDLE